MTTKLIDIHPHIVSKDTSRYPITPLGGKRSDWSAERSVTFEEYEKSMNEAGVDKAAIVHSSTTYGFNNAYVADSIEGRQARFTGVFSVDVTAPDAPEKMRHWRQRGLTGMRIYAKGSTIKEPWLALDDPRATAAWDCAADLGLSVATNMPTEGPGLEQLRAILARYPRMPIILDHLSRPSTEDGPPYAKAASFFALAKFPNLYLKATPNGLQVVRKGKATPETFLPLLVSEFGANRIAWGSNYPSSKGSLPEIVASSREILSCLPEKDREWIFAKTAQVLYPALADG